jgi:hypothetical protein
MRTTPLRSLRLPLVVVGIETSPPEIVVGVGV